MNKRWALVFGGLLLLGVACAGCVLTFEDQPRFTQHFDLGGGRILSVWSSRGSFPYLGPRLVCYRIDAVAQELVPSTFLNTDAGGDYVFRCVQADQGRVACVYDVRRAEWNPYFLIMYDAPSGESWPRVRADEANDDPAVIEKWRLRHRRLKEEHPDLPAPEPFNH